MWSDKSINLVLDRYVPEANRAKDLAAFTGQEKHDCDDMNNFDDIADYVYSCIYDVNDFTTWINGWDDFMNYNIVKEP